MFAFGQLRVPLVAAPMAGGPSTARLVAAAGDVGGLGFLAAGYRPVESMADEIDAVRALTAAEFGVNLFVPARMSGADSPTGTDAAERAAGVRRYRAELAEDAARYGVELNTTDPADTDGWDAKVAYLLDHPVPVVSFTFGVPGVETVDRFHEVGTHVMVTVSDPDEAKDAAVQGADSLCLQGPGAGGHRGTHAVAKIPDDTALPALLAQVVKEHDIPVIAAGGVGTPEQIAELIRRGAHAVQLGTLLLRTPESGATEVHKAALASGVYPDTIVTRSFSGRLARSLANGFVRRHDQTAPAAYPEVNQLVRPLRAAASAAGDADGVALWAGTGFRESRSEPARDILTALWSKARTESGRG